MKSDGLRGCPDSFESYPRFSLGSDKRPVQVIRDASDYEKRKTEKSGAEK